MTPATIHGMEAACWSGAGLLTESRRRSGEPQYRRAATALFEVMTSD
jgi:hypothetical protein